MSGTMSRVDLVADLKNSLHDAADIFTAAADADFVRLLDLAALGFSRLRPRTLIGTLALTAGQPEYSAPADLLFFKADLWRDASRMGQPWEKRWPGRLPTVMLASAADTGARKLVFSPAPSDQQIAVLGSTFRYYYFASHQIGTDASGTSIHVADRGLLLLRAQAEAMREMTLRNVGKPVQMRDGLSGQPRNGMPAHLYSLLMADFERMAA